MTENRYAVVLIFAFGFLAGAFVFTLLAPAFVETGESVTSVEFDEHDVVCFVHDTASGDAALECMAMNQTAATDGSVVGADADEGGEEA